MRYEEKADLQDGNKARAYEDKKKQDKLKKYKVLTYMSYSKTIEVKAKNKDMAWDKIQNDGYWSYEQVGDDECIEWNYVDCQEVNE